MNSLPVMPVRFRASPSNSDQASRFVNSRTTGTRPFARRPFADLRATVFGGAFLAAPLFATVRLAAVLVALRVALFRAGAFFPAARLGPRATTTAFFRAGAFLDRAPVARGRATAFDAGFFLVAGRFAGALFVALRAGFEARGFVFIAYLFYAARLSWDRGEVSDQRSVCSVAVHHLVPCAVYDTDNSALVGNRNGPDEHRAQVFVCPL